LPILTSDEISADTAQGWLLLQAQHQLPGGIKFARAPGSDVLMLCGDLPLHPRPLVQPRWQGMQQGFVQALRQLKRLRRGMPSPLAGDAHPTLPTVTLPESVQTLLHEGNWSWTTHHDETLVTVPLYARVHLVKLQQLEGHGVLRCWEAHTLPGTLSTVCRQAIAAFLLESNARLRLVRCSLREREHPEVMAEVSLESAWVDVTTLGQALDAVAVATHVVWPVLPALATESVAHTYIQKCGVA
jgi:hypothetical protein